MSLDFENLKAYQLALTWIETWNHLRKMIPDPSSKNLVDLLTHTAASIPLHIATSQSRPKREDKRQYLWMASSAVHECVAILQVLQRRGLIVESDYKKAYEQIRDLTESLRELVDEADSTS